MIPTTLSRLGKIPGVSSVELEPGSLILFSNAFNRTWKHGIPIEPTVKGMRISLTYRHF